MEVSAQFLILVPVALGLTKAVNIAGLGKRWSALVSITFGIVGAFMFAGISGGSTLGGVIAGLTAAGLWSGTKATFRGS